MNEENNDLAVIEYERQVRRILTSEYNDPLNHKELKQHRFPKKYGEADEYVKTPFLINYVLLCFDIFARDLKDDFDNFTKNDKGYLGDQTALLKDIKFNQAILIKENNQSPDHSFYSLSKESYINHTIAYKSNDGLILDVLGKNCIDVIGMQDNPAWYFINLIINNALIPICSQNQDFQRFIANINQDIINIDRGFIDIYMQRIQNRQTLIDNVVNIGNDLSEKFNLIDEKNQLLEVEENKREGCLSETADGYRRDIKNLYSEIKNLCIENGFENQWNVFEKMEKEGIENYWALNEERNNIVRIGIENILGERLLNQDIPDAEKKFLYLRYISYLINYEQTDEVLNKTILSIRELDDDTEKLEACNIFTENFLNLRKIEEAEKLCKGVIDNDTTMSREDKVNFCNKIIDIFLDKGKSDEAIEICKHTINKTTSESERAKVFNFLVGSLIIIKSKPNEAKNLCEYMKDNITEEAEKKNSCLVIGGYFLRGSHFNDAMRIYREWTGEEKEPLEICKEIIEKEERLYFKKEIYIESFNSFLEQGNFDEAIEICKYIIPKIEDRAERNEIFFSSVNSFLLLKKSNKAKRVCESVIRETDNEEKRDLCLGAARIFLYCGEFKQAIEFYKQGTDSSDDRTDPDICKEIIKIGSTDSVKAKMTFKSFIYFVNQKKIDEAIEICKHGIDNIENKAEREGVFYSSLHSLLSLKESDKAMEICESVINGASNEEKKHLYLGVAGVFLYHGELEQAIEFYKQGTDNLDDKTDLDICKEIINTGGVNGVKEKMAFKSFKYFIDQKKIDEAIEICEYGINKMDGKREREGLFLSFLDSLILLKKSDKAMEIYKLLTSEANNEDKEELSLGVARAFLYCGEFEQAINFYKQEIDSPDDKTDLDICKEIINTGYVEGVKVTMVFESFKNFVNQKKVDEAIKICEYGINEIKDKEEKESLFFNSVELLILLKKSDKAMEIYKLATSKANNEDKEKLCLGMAGVFLYYGEFEQAINFYKQEIDSSDDKTDLDIYKEIIKTGSTDSVKAKMIFESFEYFVDQENLEGATEIYKYGMEEIKNKEVIKDTLNSFDYSNNIKEKITGLLEENTGGNKRSRDSALGALSETNTRENKRNKKTSVDSLSNVENTNETTQSTNVHQGKRKKKDRDI